MLKNLTIYFFESSVFPAFEHHGGIKSRLLSIKNEGVVGHSTQFGRWNEFIIKSILLTFTIKVIIPNIPRVVEDERLLYYNFGTKRIRSYKLNFQTQSGFN